MATLQPMLAKQDRRANILIWILSVVVFAAVFVLSRVELQVDLGFDIHLFALFNAIINTIVSLLLIAGLIAVRNRKLILHRNLMLTAIGLSILFLIFYILHHLFAGSTTYGGEGTMKTIYLVILFSHIVLAGIILPFILYTAYRSLTGEYKKHKKIARITYPIWLYVSITGVVVYLMISPYY